jgi:hypothetical protein
LDGYVRQSWSDGKKHKIEDNLSAFIKSLSRTAVQKKENIKKLEQEERDRIEREKRWAIERGRAEEEKRKFEKPMRAVEDWHKSRKVRGYIAKVEEMAATGKYSFNFEGGLDNWLKCAKATEGLVWASSTPFREKFPCVDALERMSDIGRAFAFGSCAYVYGQSSEIPGGFGDWFSQAEGRHRRGSGVWRQGSQFHRGTPLGPGGYAVFTVGFELEQVRRQYIRAKKKRMEPEGPVLKIRELRPLWRDIRANRSTTFEPAN